MFGKNDPIITDKDVGDFVKQLHNNAQPLKDIKAEVEDAKMATNSPATTTRAQGKGAVYRMRYGRQQPTNKPRT